MPAKPKATTTKRVHFHSKSENGGALHYTRPLPTRPPSSPRHHQHHQQHQQQQQQQQLHHKHHRGGGRGTRLIDRNEDEKNDTLCDIAPPTSRSGQGKVGMIKHPEMLQILPPSPSPSPPSVNDQGEHDEDQNYNTVQFATALFKNTALSSPSRSPLMKLGEIPFTSCVITQGRHRTKRPNSYEFIQDPATKVIALPDSFPQLEPRPCFFYDNNKSKITPTFLITPPFLATFEIDDQDDDGDETDDDDWERIGLDGEVESPIIASRHNQGVNNNITSLPSSAPSTPSTSVLPSVVDKTKTWADVLGMRNIEPWTIAPIVQ